MKLLCSVLCLFVLVGSVFAQDAQTKAAAVADNLGSAVGKSDLEKIDGMFDKGATIYWVHQKFYGKAAFEKYLHGQFVSYDHNLLSFSPEGGVEDDTMSTSWGTCAFLYGKDDQSLSNRLMCRYTLVSTKDKDGNWKIVSLHVSISYPPDLPPTIN